MITALIGSLFTFFSMDGMEAFQTVVNKPSFTPPGIVFGIAWTILLLGLIVYMILVFYKEKPAAAYLQIPYLLWTIFATILTYGVFSLN